MERRKSLRFGDLKVACCPYCGSVSFKKDGTRCCKQRYRCKGCSRTFTALTGTFLSGTKKSEAAWKKYVIFLTDDLTVKAGSIKSILPSPKKAGYLTKKGGKQHGISRNLIAVEAAVDSVGRCLAVVLGKGKPTEDMIYDALYVHIRKGSRLVHDLFHGHAKLVRALGGKEVAVNSAEPEAFSALQRIDSFCSLLRRVISLHMGERRENLQCYLDWVCLRRYANTLKSKERKKFMLGFCASTGIDYRRPRKKRPGKAD